MRILKVIYVLAIAAALIALVVVGIHAFYPAPSYSYGSAYEQEAAIHDRNVFLIALPLGLVFAAAGTFIQRRTSIFAAGLIVGGMGTMIFAVTPYHLGDIPKFIGIAVILAVLIFVGYRVFFALKRA
jgi:hypothetical protein